MISQLSSHDLGYHGPRVAERPCARVDWRLEIVHPLILGFDEAKAPPVRLLRGARNAGRKCSQLRARLLRNADVHLRDVNLETFLELRRDVEGYPGELAVFIHGAQAVPSPALDQAVSAVDVEPLLPVALPRPGGVEMGVRATELNLAGSPPTRRSAATRRRPRIIARYESGSK